MSMFQGKFKAPEGYSFAGYRTSVKQHSARGMRNELELRADEACVTENGNIYTVTGGGRFPLGSYNPIKTYMILKRVPDSLESLEDRLTLLINREIAAIKASQEINDY